MAKRPTGRPSALTSEVQANICEGVGLGLSLADAAHRAGISRATAFIWARKGSEQKRGPFRDFLDALDAARAKRRVNINAQMISHGKKHWQALAWLAERTDPKHYGLRIKVQVNEELERVMDKLEKRLTPGEYERALEAISEPDDSPEEIGDDSGFETPRGPGVTSSVGTAVVAALSVAEPSTGTD